MRSLVLPLADSVELAVADHYGDAWYVENSLFNGLLGLAIWDLVFADVPGRFQTFPGHAAGFQRTGLYGPAGSPVGIPLQAKLKEPGHLAELVQRNYQAHYSQVNPWYSGQPRQNLCWKWPLARIPSTPSARCFDRLLEDLPNHRSGLPDLIRFPDSGGYELVEVKGRGSPAEQSGSVDAFFARESIPHALVNVVWKEMNG